jgi:hypothetical protein
MKTDQSRFGTGLMSGAPAGRQDEQPPQQQGRPQQEDVARFESLVGSKRVEAEAKPAEPPSPPRFSFSAPGDAMLRGMAGGAGAGDNRAIGRLVEAIASRVLVGDGSGGARREVRIEIGEEIFPGMRIRVFEESGRIVVAFSTPNAADLGLLRARSAELATRLKERTGREVELRFTRRDASGDADDGGDA